MQTLERRVTAQPIRRDSESQKRVLAGLAARFNTLSSDLGGFVERLAPGCFSGSLKSGRNIRMLMDHDTWKILGSVSNRTLTLRESAVGLNFRCELPDTSVARDVYALCERGDLKECSFGFICNKDSWDDEPDPRDRSRKIIVRTVSEADLLEISAVAWPAYENGATSVAVGRSLFPAAVPASAPMEMRSRINAATQLHSISDREYLDRLAARQQAERLLDGLPDYDALARVAAIKATL